MNTPPRAPSLPIIPSTARRRAISRSTRPLLAVLPPVAVTPGRSQRQRFEHVGVKALCFASVLMVGALVVFSIQRDQAGMKSTEPLLHQPLKP